MDENHSPLPWTYKAYGGFADVDAANGKAIADCTLKADAALIVTACNNFADLVKACESWLEHYDGCVRDKTIGDEPGIPQMRAALVNAKKARNG
jgi:hypothetical protein